MKIMLPKITYKQPHIYLIQRKQAFDVSGVWYFHNLGDIILEDTYSIMWTPMMSRAQVFQSEEDVEEFRHDFLYDRSTEIIRIKKGQ